MALSFILLCITFTSIVSGTCIDNDHRVDLKELPYVKGTIHDCQYAGTIPVSKHHDHNLFYWFFRHVADPNAPLILWLNGGPGATSMTGTFLENGPLRVTSTGSGMDDFSLHAAEKSWADDYNIIFLDQPVGTGFSYGNSSVTDMNVGAIEFHTFMLKFYDLYPELK